MELPDAIKDFSLGAAVVGLIGALVSVANQRELSKKEQLFTLLSGALTAGFVGYPIHEYLAFPAGWAGAISFLVGLFGRSVIITMIAAVKDINIKSIISSKTKIPFNSDSSGGN